MKDPKPKTVHCYLFIEDHNGEITRIDLGKYDILGWMGLNKILKKDVKGKK